MRNQWEMRLDYQATDITWSYLRYNNFSIESANEEYPLTVGGFTRMGHDAFISGSHNDMKLSTLGKDNDKSTRNVYMCSCTREKG